MAVVERKLHERKEMWFPYLQKNNEFFATTTATKTPQICIFDNEKQYFCSLCTCIFHLLTFWTRPRSFYEVKWPFFAVVWTTWAYDDKCSILSCPKRWFRFNSRIVKAHFSRIMTLNNWKIAETRSDIFRWRSRFRRRRVCLSSLLKLPYERPTGPGLTWQIIWLAIEDRHCMEPASWELISY